MPYAAKAWKFALLFLLTLNAAADDGAAGIVIGETFAIQSEVLNEARPINVFTPTVYGEPVDKPLPVLYMLDGGIEEDFLHIAGLLQVFVSNGSIRPLMLVGIQNTARRRDMTGPSEDPEDQAMAPQIGGAEPFRRFIREELFAQIEQRYPVSDERAVVGESLAGLFVVETLLHSPEMFDTYIAADPSVWWNRYALNDTVTAQLEQEAVRGRRLFVAASKEASSSERFKAFMSEIGKLSDRVTIDYLPMPEESHATLFHPAALKALRRLFPAEHDN